MATISIIKLDDTDFAGTANETFTLDGATIFHGTSTTKVKGVKAVLSGGETFTANFNRKTGTSTDARITKLIAESRAGSGDGAVSYSSQTNQTSSSATFTPPTAASQNPPSETEWRLNPSSPPWSFTVTVRRQ